MNDTIDRAAPQGTGYGRPRQKPNALLTQVGPGTPCGEYMRRFWQPVLASSSVTSRPCEIRILGEDLVAFRDGQGKPGLLYSRCMHRGANLFWGHVESDGIRCCYHGWKFDVEGRCLEQPCEPPGRSRKEVHRQPWYPVEERYGLLWAYMGPPEKMPLLPRFDCMEPLGEGESYYALDNSLSAHADMNGPAVVPYSWLNINDNCMDPFHAQVLHASFGTTHFVPEFAVMPKVEFERIEGGVIYKAYRQLGDGRQVTRINTWIAPNITSVPSLQLAPGRSERLTIFVPVDDTHTRAVLTQRVKPGFPGLFGARGFGTPKPWSQMTIEERQDAPGDYEAQSTADGLSLHSEEHLATSDVGIAWQRRLLTQEIEKVARGEDPIGVAFKVGDEVIHVPSGNFFEGAGTK
ncbi:aromatic ring-hydroxylating dioxygenase subunit alpha [soil metagenome]